jgi:hypothetical protein
MIRETRGKEGFLMNEHSAGVYRDIYGQELVDITIEEDGQFLAMTVRDIHFRGLGFDFFYVWPADQDAEKLRQFHLRERRIPPGNRVQFLCDYTLQWTMPLSTVKQGQTLVGTLCGNHGGDDHWAFVLQIADQLFEATTRPLNIEKVLEQFQQQLPSTMFLKCCQFCAFSAYEPFSGEGSLCFRNKKGAFRAIKYQPQPRSKIQINALRNEGGVEYVQEMYLCSEFEVDLTWLEIVRQTAE